jgi:hypothetical protein
MTVGIGPPAFAKSNQRVPHATSLILDVSHRLSLFLAASVGAAVKGESPLDRVKWQRGPGKVSLGKHAEINVPEGYQFTAAEGTQRLLQLMGNPTSGAELGFLAPTKMDWFVVFEFNDVGYVKDDEKDQLNADKMLEAIRRGTEEANKERKEMGVPGSRSRAGCNHRVTTRRPTTSNGRSTAKAKATKW